jgi:hypothetical protein
MKKIATANSIMAMTYGYRILAAMTDNVLSDATLMQRFRDLKPDLIIGDSTASYGHWLTALLGVPSIEFDVGTSSGLLHSTFGGQVNPAYIPASGKNTICCFEMPAQHDAFQLLTKLLLTGTELPLLLTHWQRDQLSRQTI